MFQRRGIKDTSGFESDQSVNYPYVYVPAPLMATGSQLCTFPVPAKHCTLQPAASLRWHPVPGALSYNVYRAAAQVASGVTGTSYSDYAVPPGKTSTYYITAIVNGLEGMPSGTAFVTMH